MLENIQLGRASTCIIFDSGKTIQSMQPTKSPKLELTSDALTVHSRRVSTKGYIA